MDTIIADQIKSGSDRLDLSGSDIGEKGGGALADRLVEELPFVKHLILTGIRRTLFLLIPQPHLASFRRQRCR